MLAAPPVLALAGKLGALTGERLRELVSAPAPRARASAKRAARVRRFTERVPRAGICADSIAMHATVSLADLQRAISLLGEGERGDVEIEIGVARFAADRS